MTNIIEKITILLKCLNAHMVAWENLWYFNICSFMGSPFLPKNIYMSFLISDIKCLGYNFMDLWGLLSKKI
jgi:hypothetical protein